MVLECDSPFTSSFNWCERGVGNARCTREPSAGAELSRELKCTDACMLDPVQGQARGAGLRSRFVQHTGLSLRDIPCHSSRCTDPPVPRATYSQVSEQIDDLGEASGKAVQRREQCARRHRTSEYLNLATVLRAAAALRREQALECRPFPRFIFLSFFLCGHRRPVATVQRWLGARRVVGSGRLEVQEPRTGWCVRQGCCANCKSQFAGPKSHRCGASGALRCGL